MVLGLLPLLVALTPVADFGDNPGELLLYTALPDGPGPHPLVVVMHGCTMSAEDMDEETGVLALAEAAGVALAFPEQAPTNDATRCFRSFELEDATRGEGEVASIAAMIDHLVATADVDPARVYVTGLSAGASMSFAMLATYPELFAAGAAFAGMTFRCATSSASLFTCGAGFVTKTGPEWGDLVRAASSHGGPWPRVSVWHGTADLIINDHNADESVKQWTNVHGVSATPSSVTAEGPHERRTYGDPSAPVVEQWVLPGMGHGVPVDLDVGCGLGALYMLDVNVCGMARAFAFFGLETSPGSDGGLVEPGPPDAGGPDGGTGLDGGPPPPGPSDGGRAPDGGPRADGGTGAGDAGGALDGGIGRDPLDAGERADGGDSSPAACACAQASSPAAPGAAMILLFLGVLARRRRGAGRASPG